MLEKIIELDHRLFRWVNQDMANPVFDWFFPIWTDIQKTPVFYFLILPLIFAVVFWRARLAGVMFILASATSVAIADFLASKFIKPWFTRARPFSTGQGDEVILRISEVGSSSFPSSHALDAFCLAAFVGCFFPKLAWILFPLAFLTAYSRVYNGVHFPTDVLGGAVIGSLIGLILAFLFWPLGKKLMQKIKDLR